MTAPRDLAPELAELRASIDRLAGDTSALQRAIDHAREQSERDRAEYERRLAEQAAEVKRVGDESAPLTEVEADRVAVRRRFRIAGLVLAALLAALVGLYVHSTRQSIAQLQQQRDASCVAFDAVGHVTLSPTSSPLARRVVTTHADAARKLGCEK